MVVDFVCFCVRVCECVSVRVRACMRVCVCVSRPLWSPLIPNLTDLLQRQPLMCAESHSGILDAASIIFTSFFPHQEYIVWFSPPRDAGTVRQDRWLMCYEFVYNSGVYSSSSLICNFTSLSSFNPILILCKPSNL